MDSIIWMDTRGAKEVSKLAHGPIRVEGYGVGKLLKWIRISGGGPTKSGKDSIAHILYIKNKLPKIYEQTYKFLEPKDYLNLWLTGRFVASYDSITLYWVTDNRDINNVTYNDELVKLTGVDRGKFPDLVPTNSILGPVKKEIAQEFGLNADVQVVSGTPDVQSAAVGSGAVKDYEGHFYVGTSSWLVCHVPFKKTDIFHNMGTIPSAIPGRYLIANEQESAGACLNYVKNNLLYHTDELNTGAAPKDFYKLVDRMVEKVPAGARASVNKKLRSGVGLISSKKVVFIISEGEVNFYDFAVLFKSVFNCQNALFLDGAISMMYLRDKLPNEIGGHFCTLISATRKKHTK